MTSLLHVQPPHSQRLRVCYPGPFSNNVIREEERIMNGTEKVIDRSMLPEQDRRRLEIIEANLEIVTPPIVSERNEIKTVEVSRKNAGDIGTVLAAMVQEGLERPSYYYDGFVIQLNF